MSSNTTLDISEDMNKDTSGQTKRNLNLRRFAKATGVFIRTPMRKFLRKLPQRSPELGGERKAFDLNVFVLESWRSASGRKRFNTKSFETMEAFSEYITRVDDILDSINHPPLSDWGQYRADKTARRGISIFVNHVLDMKKGNFLTKQQANTIFRAAGDYRRQAQQALERFDKLRNPDIKEILKVKEETTGGMGSIMVEILDVAEKIPIEQNKVLKKAFSDAFMATQVADDMHDIHDDMANRVPNIAVAVLQKYPEEFEVLVEGRSTSISSYRKLAPESYRELMQIGQTYISLVPSKPESVQVLDAIPRIFYKAIQLTSRGD